MREMRKTNLKENYGKQPKKPIKQFNRNGIRMISDRPPKPKYFPGE